MSRRNHKAEYKRRLARGLARGLTRSQARGHTKVHTRGANALPPVDDDPRIETAIRDMNRGESMTAAARASHISRRRLRAFLAQRRLGKRKGRRWVTKDNRLRRVPVMTGGRFRVLTVRGYEQARVVGEHHHAVGEFVRTNVIGFIKPFEGQSVRAVNGRQHPLETDPNTLHRIAALETPPFHEIYEITSNS